MSKTVYMQTERGDIFSTTMPHLHKDCVQLPQSEGVEKYRAGVIADLKSLIKPGSVIYTKLESVSASGMSRRISVYVVRPAKKGEAARISNISYSVSVATGDRMSEKGGIVATGCGMDMGFAIVYALGRALWPKGTTKPHGTRNGAPDKDGAYVLKHEWI